MIFIDTNYINRYLVGDIVDQHQKVKLLFLDALNKKVQLISNTLVFFEVCFSLQRFYSIKESDILDGLFEIIVTETIKFDDNELLLTAIKLSKTNNLGIGDNYNLAWSLKNNVTEFKTFDKKLNNTWKELKP